MGTERASETGTILTNLLQDSTSPEAWSAFVDHYGPKILGWCRKWNLQEADARDVTQTVLTKLVQRLRTFRYDRGKGTFRGWLKTLTHHAWRDFLEDRDRAGAGTGDTGILQQLQTVAAGDDLVQELEQEFQRELLEAAQRQVQLLVSPRDWKIFQALTLEGRPGAEVARELGMTVTAVYMAKSRVQKKLREAVRRLDGGDREEGKP